MQAPLKIGQPEEVANAVLYFVSDDASWTTGSTQLLMEENQLSKFMDLIAPEG